MGSRPVLALQLALVTVSLASCSRVVPDPAPQAAAPAPTSTPAPPAPKPTPPIPPSFRADLFQNFLRAAAGFRNTKETIDPVLNELKFLQLQKLSGSEKTVFDILTTLAESQVKLVKLKELKDASDKFIKDSLPTAAKLGPDWKLLYEEARQKQASGYALVGSKFRMMQEWGNVLAPAIETVGVPLTRGEAGGEYINYSDSRKAFESAAEACLQTAADMISNNGAVSTQGR